MAHRWTLPAALDLIRMLQPPTRDLGYHIMLGGGVLNRGESDKDLDLFFHPLNGYDPNAGAILNFLHEQFGEWGRSIRDSPDYGHDALFHYAEAKMYDYDGLRIDVFIR